MSDLNELLNEGLSSFIKECMYADHCNKGLEITTPSQYTVKTKRGYRNHPFLAGEAIRFDSCYFGKSQNLIFVFTLKHASEDVEHVEIPLKRIGYTNFEENFGEVFRAQGYSTLQEYFDDLINRVSYERMEMEALEKIASGDSLWGSFA